MQLTKNVAMSSTLARACGALALLSALAGGAQATQLYYNGPVVGADGKSVFQDGSTIYGFGALYPNAVADNFSVAAGSKWNVQSLDFFVYSVGATAFSFTSAVWSIVSGDVNSGSVVASGTTGVTDGGMLGYRVTQTDRNSTMRQIHAANADVGDFILDSGNYWLRWSLTGTNGSVWQSPTSDGVTGNAMQSLSGNAFTQLVDTGNGRSVELPFAINGALVVPNDVPEPASLALLLAGLCAGSLIRRQRR